MLNYKQFCRALHHKVENCSETHAIFQYNLVPENYYFTTQFTKIFRLSKNSLKNFFQTKKELHC